MIFAPNITQFDALKSMLSVLIFKINILEQNYFRLIITNASTTIYQIKETLLFSSTLFILIALPLVQDNLE